MKLVEHFKDFLNDTVNLNTTRLTQLDSSVAALKTFISGSSWDPTITSWAEQGSWAHKTIIKPVNERPFDADVMVFVKPVAGWDAKRYITELKAIFLASNTYKDKVSRSSHCITIEYAKERKIDIAPVVVDRDGVTRLEVCNVDSNNFERTEPGLYTNWLIERNGWTGGNGLRKVTRLLKYLRDIKTTFTCPSVLLTTLLGNQINIFDQYSTSAFTDTPTALKTIVGRLDDWLQGNPTLPTVVNPVLTSEVFSAAWDDTKYANFRDKIHTYREWIDDAYNEADRDESIGKWQRVFGEEFAASVAIERAASVSKSADLFKEASHSAIAAATDLVARFAQFGRTALPDNFDRLPHKQRPRWKVAATSTFNVTVAASLHDGRGGRWVETVEGERRSPLPKHYWMQFQLRTSTGTPLAGDYDIHWRVTNTDQEANRAGCLRGGFERSNDGSARWEQLSYRGVHTVEGFVVRKRDQQLVAQSAPFYVVIA
ncbi:cyclic GMP-AMP synthase DncV-like nucleotidyltransferase [Caulobacter sp. RHG1]|uniref:SMODS domain-containing nucleotidyltransferase n=1 Tax=Caulobacter sp. (strain RHG1) TaxID=2545762 RepID=UPI0015519267|nr:nucleotidyltransferase [Caulobacter sp. RHG1]NQE65343.1 hypothetical protein [Caulobacter sp. RHG1]